MGGQVGITSRQGFYENPAYVKLLQIQTQGFFLLSFKFLWFHFKRARTIAAVHRIVLNPMIIVGRNLFGSLQDNVRLVLMTLKNYLFHFSNGNLFIS